MCTVLEGLRTGVHYSDFIEILECFDRRIVGSQNAAAPCLHEDLRHAELSGEGRRQGTYFAVYKLRAFETEIFYSSGQVSIESVIPLHEYLLHCLSTRSHWKAG